jgi:CBS domain-containing protein
MKVKEAMHKGVEWVSPDTPVKTLASKMREYDIGVIPIGENDRLIGMVTDRDIAVRGLPDGRDLSELTARDVMTAEVIYCRETDDIDDAVQVMEDRRVRRLPVLDANKRMVGMLSLGDVSHAASQKIAAELTKAVSAHHA